MIDDNVCSEIIFAIAPYMDQGDISDARMRVMMVLSNYDIRKAKHEVVPYEGDANDKMLLRFLVAKTAAGRSRRTLAYYKNSISMTLAKIGKPYDQITANDVRIYLATRINKDGVSKTCANNERRNLSAFYSWMQKEEILLRNPMNKVEAIKETKKRKRAFEQMDLEKIRMACRNEHETALVEVLISTWARASEVCEMKIQDIQGNRITVHGKGDKYRDVYLTPRAQLALQAYLAQRKDGSPYIFPKGANIHELVRKGRKDLWYQNPKNIRDGRRDNGTLETTLRKIGQRAGVEKCHPHRFRRTGATMALRAGMPLTEVSKLLGHESLETTQIYLDIGDKQLEATHERYVT